MLPGAFLGVRGHRHIASPQRPGQIERVAHESVEQGVAGRTGECEMALAVELPKTIAVAKVGLLQAHPRVVMGNRDVGGCAALGDQPCRLHLEADPDLVRRLDRLARGRYDPATLAAVRFDQPDVLQLKECFPNGRLAHGELGGEARLGDPLP